MATSQRIGAQQVDATHDHGDCLKVECGVHYYVRLLELGTANLSYSLYLDMNWQYQLLSLRKWSHHRSSATSWYCNANDRTSFTPEPHWANIIPIFHSTLVNPHLLIVSCMVSGHDLRWSSVWSLTWWYWNMTMEHPLKMEVLTATTKSFP